MHKSKITTLLLLTVLNLVISSSGIAQDQCLLQAEILGRSEFRGYTGIGEGLAENFALLGDIDGDGVNDYAYTHPRDISTSEVYQYVVSYISGATNERLSFTVPYRRDDFTYGQNIGNIGDIDGDGLDEVFVSSHTSIYSNDGGEVYVLSPLSRKIHYVLKSGEDIDDDFGESASAVGDLNDDGVSEIAVGAYKALGPCDSQKYECSGYPYGSGVAYLFDGKSGELLWVLGTGHRGESTHFGLDVRHIGDIDGDGYGDFSVRGSIPEVRELVIFSGRKTALRMEDNIISYIHLPENYTQKNIAPFGDIDGDGLDEFLLIVEQDKESNSDDDDVREVNIMKNFGDGYIDSLYYLAKTREEDAFFGARDTITPIGDIDADNRPDLAISSFELDEYNEYIRIIELYSGRDGSLISTIRGSRGGTAYGAAIGYIGDLDNDGYGELLIGDPSDTNGVDWSNYNPSQTIFYDATDFESGLIHRIALSLDLNNNGIPEYCEAVDSSHPPASKPTPEDPSLSPSEQLTQEEVISLIIESSYSAQKRGKKKREERKEALQNIKKYITQLLETIQENTSSLSNKKQKRIKILFKKARRKKKKALWNRFRKLLIRI